MNSKWLRCIRVRPDAQIMLICFPWAGGGSAFYSNWGKGFCSEIEVHGVCLPGRENRFAEPVAKNWRCLIQELCEDVHDVLRKKPFALWGHSLGAIMCFEVARYLKLHYSLNPVHIFLSSASAPQITNKVLDVESLSDDDLQQKIQNWGGTPKELLENKEIMKMAVRVLRADLTLLQNYRFQTDDNAILHCPVTCFDGSRDLHDQDGWSDLIHGAFNRHVLTGGHFYIMEEDNLRTVQNLVSKSLGFNQRC